MSFRLLLLIAAVISASATAQTKEPPAAEKDIVVTGVRLEDTADALAACLARRCPPREDIAATLAHAENQFVAGNYYAARHTLQSSIGRNRRYAAMLPVEVAGLMRANSRIAAHLGEAEDSRSNARAVVDALRTGLPEHDSRILDAQIELGDVLARTNTAEEAAETYRQVALRAHDYSLPVTEAYARLRLASVYIGLSASRAEYSKRANAALDALINNPDPKFIAFANAARLMQAKFAARNGDTSAMENVIATLGPPKPGIRPILVYAPSVVVGEGAFRADEDGTDLDQMALDNFDNQWVDISFWIGSDGHVTGADILRQSNKLGGTWAKRLVASVSGRRYAPLAEPMLRVERFTFTSHWVSDIGTHIRRRAPMPDIEELDLTREAHVKST